MKHLSWIFLLAVVSCSEPAPHPITDDDDFIVRNALDFYRALCDDEEARVWIQDKDYPQNWDPHRRIVCGDEEKAVAHYVEVFRAAGCLTLPIPFDSVGADFEEHLCWP